MMVSIPARFGLGDPAWLDPVSVFVVILVGLIAAAVFHKLLFPLILRVTRWTPTDLDTKLVGAPRRPLTLAIVLLGVYLAVVLPLDLDAAQRERVDQIIGLMGIVVGVLIVVAIFSNVMDWYLENLATRTQNVIDVKLFPLLRRISVAIIYGLGGLLVLDLLDINISPLIAGLGLGGLAVALALQPTLANLFAGTYVMTEGVIAPGDYIELEGGTAGYVVEVGWRSTRIRTWQNNLLVVPNARFAETIITNTQLPAAAVNVWLQCGVSYDSDLDRVEKVCFEVMDQVLETEPSSVKEYGSWFGFDNFGDSNVNFWLFLQAKDRWGGYVVTSALVKLLHASFKKEGITINYPKRSLEFPGEWGPEALGLRNGQEPVERTSDGKNGEKSNEKDGRRRSRRRRPSVATHILRNVEEDGGPDGDSPDVG